jgi:carbonic anhydrase
LITGFQILKWEGTNNGHAVQLTLKSTEKLKVTGGDLPGPYLLAQFHFHWGSATAGGSEHLTGGNHHFAEIHLVHTKEGYDKEAYMSKGDGLGVLGFFVDVGENTQEGPLDVLIQQKIAKHLLEPKSAHNITNFALDTILPASLTDYYRYLGSLTTPTCNEVVVWTVFKHPILITQKTRDAMVSFAEYDDTDAPLVQNFRAAQPLNGRTITFYGSDVTEETAMPEPGLENDPSLKKETPGNNTEPVGIEVTETPTLGNDTNTTTTVAPPATTTSSSRFLTYSCVLLLPLFLLANL